MEAAKTARLGNFSFEQRIIVGLSAGVSAGRSGNRYGFYWLDFMEKIHMRHSCLACMELQCRGRWHAVRHIAKLSQFVASCRCAIAWWVLRFASLLPTDDAIGKADYAQHLLESSKICLIAFLLCSC
jgi:hypothetical protein